MAQLSGLHNNFLEPLLVDLFDPAALGIDCSTALMLRYNYSLSTWRQALISDYGSNRTSIVFLSHCGPSVFLQLCYPRSCQLLLHQPT